MTIFLNEETRVIVQGITGRTAKYHTKEMLDYGTNIVAGVTPYKAGTLVHGVPVFNTMEEAVLQHDANTSIIYVPAPFAKDAIIEAIHMKIKLIVCITEHIPEQDMILIKEYLRYTKTKLIGPNCPGVIVPGVAKLGIMPSYIHMPGNVGIVSRSGTLTYEAVNQLTQLGIGQSIAIGIGGDAISGTSFIDVLESLEKDENTDVILLIGEIGGTAEEIAANWIKNYCTKQVVAFISGASAPEGKTMGHAGAIVSGGLGTAKGKIEALEAAGVLIVHNPALIGKEIKSIVDNNEKLK